MDRVATFVKVHPPISAPMGGPTGAWNAHQIVPPSWLWAACVGRFRPSPEG